MRLLVRHGTAVIGVVRCSSVLRGIVRRGQARFGPVMLAHCQCASRIGKSFGLVRFSALRIGRVLHSGVVLGMAGLDTRRTPKWSAEVWQGSVRYCWVLLGRVLEWNGRAVFGEVRHGTVINIAIFGWQKFTAIMRFRWGMAGHGGAWQGRVGLSTR